VHAAARTAAEVYHTESNTSNAKDSVQQLHTTPTFDTGIQQHVIPTQLPCSDRTYADLVPMHGDTGKPYVVILLCLTQAVIQCCVDALHATHCCAHMRKQQVHAVEVGYQRLQVLRLAENLFM
jgi:hypothetical protein